MPPAHRGLRLCLGCRKPFPSAGPHERICPRCKETEEWLAGQAECPLAHAEAQPLEE